MRSGITGLLAAGALFFTAHVNAAAQTAEARRPVLLELFTSEGCSSCPPADKLLQSLDRTQPIAGADLIVLSEHVDYWNHAGWADPFSSSAFTARQHDYADKLGLDTVYTPQLVVDGHEELVGSNAVEARDAIAKALQQQKLPIHLSGAKREGKQISVHVELAAAPAGKGQPVVFVAVADNEDRSQVARGENAGRSLSHVAVVRTLMPIGRVNGGSFAKDITIPLTSAGQSGLRIVAFVQDGSSHKVLGVAQQKL